MVVINFANIFAFSLSTDVGEPFYISVVTTIASIYLLFDHLKLFGHIPIKRCCCLMATKKCYQLKNPQQSRNLMLIQIFLGSIMILCDFIRIPWLICNKSQPISLWLKLLISALNFIDGALLVYYCFESMRLRRRDFGGNPSWELEDDDGDEILLI